MPLRLLFLLLLLTACATRPEQDAQAQKRKEQVASYDRQGVRKTFYKNQRAIKRCYEKMLETDLTSPTGLVVLSFDVDSHGKAKQVKIVTEDRPKGQKTTLHNTQLHSCLISGVQSWTWPKAPDSISMNVIYPLHFSQKPPANMQKKMDQFQKIRK